MTFEHVCDCYKMLHNDDDDDADDDGPPAESPMSNSLDHISFWNYSLVLNVSDDTFVFSLRLD